MEMREELGGWRPWVVVGFDTGSQGQIHDIFHFLY
jgi:hypothetical protein